MLAEMMTMTDDPASIAPRSTEARRSSEYAQPDREDMSPLLAPFTHSQHRARMG
jgi:hypothetical protein